MVCLRGWRDGETTGDLTVKSAGHLKVKSEESWVMCKMKVPRQVGQVSIYGDGAPQVVLLDEVGTDDTRDLTV